MLENKNINSKNLKGQEEINSLDVPTNDKLVELESEIWVKVKDKDDLSLTCELEEDSNVMPPRGRPELLQSQ